MGTKGPCLRKDRSHRSGRSIFYGTNQELFWCWRSAHHPQVSPNVIPQPSSVWFPPEEKANNTRDKIENKERGTSHSLYLGRQEFRDALIRHNGMQQIQIQIVGRPRGKLDLNIQLEHNLKFIIRIRRHNEGKGLKDDKPTFRSEISTFKSSFFTFFIITVTTTNASVWYQSYLYCGK